MPNELIEECGYKNQECYGREQASAPNSIPKDCHQRERHRPKKADCQLISVGRWPWDEVVVDHENCDESGGCSMPFFEEYERFIVLEHVIWYRLTLELSGGGKPSALNEWLGRSPTSDEPANRRAGQATPNNADGKVDAAEVSDRRPDTCADEGEPSDSPFASKLH
ncbi:hypothetical protein ISP17_05075 [Dyella ginsengisoli]|uniref:HNH endonuclease n=1 Tax=Dyella ginsengisoli TaxID=363848 RepID=A0ABW8JSU4_9GAMM